MAKKDEELLEEDEFEWDDDPADTPAIQSNIPPSLPVGIEVDDVELPMAWATTTTQVDEVRKHRKMFNLKHGLFVNVPMVCKGADCPLHQTCTIAVSNRVVGERCPIEIAAIIDRFDKYCRELRIGPEDYFDQSQVKDLVDIEIKLMRANGKLAISADFIEEVFADVDNNGNVYTKPELHMATVYEEKLLARKAKILSDLNSTRRQKEKNKQMDDPSSFASQLIQRAMKAGFGMHIIDAEVVEPDNDLVDITPEDGDQ